MHNTLAEVGLVHGSGFEVIGDTYAMSTGSRLNAERAAMLLSAKCLEKVICSGRGPVQDENYGATEAQLMADYLIRAGFEHSQIEVEDMSTSAVGNWANSASIISEIEATSVMGVSA
ncbi:MAG: ElyC/SanA/YdcF family protein, partial [Candidatus Saccharimonadales bacterium]